MKKCKYCKKEIEDGAKVCPYCTRDQRWGNNPLFLIPIIVIIAVFLYLFLSPRAPLKFREFVCVYGIRSDKTYCSYYTWEE